MKRTAISTLMLCAMAGFAQPYGQTFYSNSADLQAGSRTGLNSAGDGFIMIGMKSADIHIEKTTNGGAVPTLFGALGFERDYSIYETAGSCFSANSLVSTCSGANVIEIPAYNSAWFAMAGAYENACFLTFLSPDGVPINTITYKFPATASAYRRPCIVQNPVTGGYYISGQYNDRMYVIKVDAGGAVDWSHFYDVSGTLEPRAMLVSPHNGDLVVVGHMAPDPSYLQASDCMFLSLDPATGFVNAFKDYNSTPCNWFNSIHPAFSPNGGVGYILSGHNDPSLGHNGGSLMMKVGIGGNIIWNTVITSGAPSVYSDEAFDAVERRTTSGGYVYYGLAQTIDQSQWPTLVRDMSIFKLNDNGMPYSWTNPGQFDEYHYFTDSSTEYYPKSLTQTENGSGIDEGLHAYVSSNGYMLQESYFNGVTGCSNESFFHIASVEVGPQDIDLNMIITPGPVNCIGVDVIQAVAPSAISQPCSAGTVPGGNNLRQSVATGIQANSAASPKAYPNPSNGLYTLEVAQEAQISIYNVLGESIKNFTLAGGKYTLDLLGQPNGVYLININTGSSTQQFRLVKE